MTIDEYKEFMLQWNIRFPYDRWWRKKHNVAFMSAGHRDISFFAQMMEYQEDRIFAEMAEKREEKRIGYEPDTGDWLLSDFDRQYAENGGEEGFVPTITRNDITMFEEEMKSMIAAEKEAKEKSSDDEYREGNTD